MYLYYYGIKEMYAPMNETIDIFAIEELTAAEITADMKIGWNLGNTLDCLTNAVSGIETETAWGNPYTTRRLFEIIYATGFRAVRIPVTWAGHFGAAPDYLIDPEWMDRVETIVTDALSCGLYVILNMHHDGADLPELGAWLFPDFKTYERHLDRFIALWTQIARKFEKYGSHLLFEGMNEPHCEDDWLGSPENYIIVNRLNDTFVSTIRQSGGNNEKRCLLVPTYAASAKVEPVQSMVFPRDDRLILSIHAYMPTEFCFPACDVTWTTPRTEWGTEEDRRQLTDCFDRLAVQGLPVIIGEMGCVQKRNNSRNEWASFYIREAKKRGITCFWWDATTYGETMGLLDRNTYLWSDPLLIRRMIAASEVQTEGKPCS